MKVSIRPLAYAAFLACSWAWCIGLFLPILLLRDFGFWSFVVFAVPNCVGAAAMGVFLWRPGASERFLEGHFAACRAFSCVTMMFQVWFLLVLMDHGRAWISVLAPAAVVGIVLGLMAARPSFKPRAVASFVALAASLGIVVWWLMQVGVAPPRPVPAPTETPLELLALAPVCIFGFMLSPYLDLTFHAARQSVPGQAGSRTFLVGFLVLFPAMLVLTFLYGRHALAANAAEPIAALAWPVAAHIVMQVLFTAMVHGPGIGPFGLEKARRFPVLPALVVLIPVALASAQEVAVPADFLYAGLTFFEIVYRVFIAFYGLVFPAYVLLAAVGANGFRGRPSTRTWVVFAGAVALAAPCYWMGFIERETVWLVPGVVIVVLARGLIKA